jgi:hypothetical protein
VKVFRLAATLLLFAGLDLPSSDGPREVPLELKRKLTAQINEDRRANGLSPVEFSAELSRAADAHCREMLHEDYMSHWNRAGWKPYMRYARAGIRDFTAENVWALHKTHMETDPSQLWNEMLNAHRGFMAERPPADGHRQAVLGRQHTHVGIGAAFNSRGMRLIELFAARYVALQPLPAEAQLKDRLNLAGQILFPTHELYAISVFYETLPVAMTALELRLTGAYGLPDDERVERPRLSVGMYSDGKTGIIQMPGPGRFEMPVNFWKNRAGVYTLAVWVRGRGQSEAFIGGMTSVFVTDDAAPQNRPGRAPR